MDHRRLIAAAAVVAALLASGCGPTPPQAPGPEAHKLNEALSTFSSACGHAAEVNAFSRSQKLISGLDALAGSKVPDLARIYKRNQGWIFQGKSVAKLVSTSYAYLSECGLHRAAARLKRATSG